MNDLHVVSHRAEHRELARANRYAAEVTFNILDRYLDIESVLDLGCGTGIWMHAALQKNGRDVFGVEVEKIPADELSVNANLIANESLAADLDFGRFFDLVLCLETAEHIDSEYAQHVVSNCVKHADVVLFSAAIPGQGGLHHVNEQWPEYWAKLFDSANFEAIDLIRPLIWHDNVMPVWYRQNMLLFVNRQRKELISKLQAGAVTGPLGQVHPELMQIKIAQIQSSESEIADQLKSVNERLQESLTALRDELTIAQQRSSELELDLARLNDRAEKQFMAVYKTLSWRLTVPVRKISAGIRRLRGRAPKAPFWPIAHKVDDADVVDVKFSRSRNSSAGRTKISFISGEPTTPGHTYRILNMANALPELYYDVLVIAASDVHHRIADITNSHIVWIWRASWSSDLANAIGLARQNRAKIVFDIDDLMFRPELATIDVVDGIRSLGLVESDIKTFYRRIRRTMQEADLCVAPTLRLAKELIHAGKPAAVIPNGYTSDSRERAAEAIRLAAPLKDDLVRIGYAAGSRTHQRDFALVVPALSKLMASRPNVRLVLPLGAIELSEFPLLEPFASQIERREYVPLERMLIEYARYDVNIMPLEVENRFCEAKSELKFFEAALVGVPTVASPTDTYSAAIRHGETGFLANSDEEWYETLAMLVDDAGLRGRIAEAARHEVMWNYGPERRAFALRRTIGRLLSEPAVEAGLFQAQIADDIYRPLMKIDVPDYSVLLDKKSGKYSRIAVILPCFNYSRYIEQALESVLSQTYRDIDVVVIDDCSTDDSVAVAQAWLERNANSFNRVALLKNKINSKLGSSRNAAISFAGTELFFPLDPDNLIKPDCIERCLEALDSSGAAAAYPKIESFGDTAGQVWYLSEPPWQPDRFRSGNYIDAMALIRTSCWAAVGGYLPFLYGWEDYDLWCRFAEHGFFAINVPHVTAFYRFHDSQMIKTVTQKNTEPLLAAMRARHPWVHPTSS